MPSHRKAKRKKKRRSNDLAHDARRRSQQTPRPDRVSRTEECENGAGPGENDPGMSEILNWDISEAQTIKEFKGTQRPIPGAPPDYMENLYLDLAIEPQLGVFKRLVEVKRVVSTRNKARRDQIIRKAYASSALLPPRKLTRSPNLRATKTLLELYLPRINARKSGERRRFSITQGVLRRLTSSRNFPKLLYYATMSALKTEIPPPTQMKTTTNDPKEKELTNLTKSPLSGAIPRLMPTRDKTSRKKERTTKLTLTKPTTEDLTRHQPPPWAQPPSSPNIVGTKDKATRQETTTFTNNHQSNTGSTSLVRPPTPMKWYLPQPGVTWERARETTYEKLALKAAACLSIRPLDAREHPGAVTSHRKTKRKKQCARRDGLTRPAISSSTKLPKNTERTEQHMSPEKQDRIGHRHPGPTQLHHPRGEWTSPSTKHSDETLKQTGYRKALKWFLPPSGVNWDRWMAGRYLSGRKGIGLEWWRDWLEGGGAVGGRDGVEWWRAWLGDSGVGGVGDGADWRRAWLGEIWYVD